MDAVAERRRYVTADRQGDVESPLLGDVLEIVADAQVKVRVSGPDEVLTASCLEHVLARSGGLDALIGEQVLLVAVGGNRRQLVVCGVIARARAARPNQVAEAASAPPQTARIDGRRVVLEAADEIVLQCGQGSLTLTADGRIVIKGVDIVSRARRTNKIKGGTVNIN